MVLTFDRAHEVLKLDPETGILTWKGAFGGRTTAGVRAGYVHAGGYRWIKIDGRPYREHLIVWFMLTGEWCPRKIDHNDRDRSNNKPSNLRRASESQQRMNSSIRSDNTSGYRGVYFHKLRGKYVAEIRKLGIKHYLGLFETPEEAAAVARAKRAELFGAFAPSYDHTTGGL